MNDEPTQTEINEKLLGYILRNDARIIGLIMSISDALGHDEQQKEAFKADVETNFKIVYQTMLEMSEDIDPALSARLLGETFPDLNDE